MIYKFECQEANLELCITPHNRTEIKIITPEDNESIVSLNKDNLYDIIGALHSIQSKIKEVKNG